MRKGFTVVEIIIVVIIVAILGAIVYPKFMEGNTDKISVVEVMCPGTVTDTIADASQFVYYSNSLRVFRKNGKDRLFPTTCVVREIQPDRYY